jgi:uncharacterized protein (TIGR00725 family)
LKEIYLKFKRHSVMNFAIMLKVAVLGSATTSEESPVGRYAFRIGELVANRGAALLTGGCGGLPHSAALGARGSGGLTVAVSPATNLREHSDSYSYPADSDVIMFTGMGRKGRNVILVRSADACIFIGGGTGTLNEFTIAFDELGSERAIGVLKGSGGIADELPHIVKLVGKTPRAHICVESHPDALIERLFAHIQRY